jgi:biopolymer transport protein TolR
LRPASVIEVIVGTDDHLRIRIDKNDPQPTTLTRLAGQVNDLQAGRNDVPVVIAADRQVRYESVVKVMDILQKAGVLRIGLAVKQTG